MSDALADLGLDFGVEEEKAVKPAPKADKEPATDAPKEAKAPRAPREEVEIGELAFGKSKGITGIRRAGATGSKYKFDKLAAPVGPDADGDYEYDTFTAFVQEGVDADKLKRSVQQAVSTENRKEKADGTVKRYATRAVTKDGVFAGVKVYRVDGTLGEDDGE